MGPVLFSQSRTGPLPGGSQLSHSLSLGDVVTPLWSRTPSGVLFGFRPWLFARVSGDFWKKSLSDALKSRMEPLPGGS